LWTPGIEPSVGKSDGGVYADYDVIETKIAI